MKRRILIVEDELEVRELLQRGLSEDYDVVLAEDGFAGLTEALVGYPDLDLVITDLNMPGITGFELIENLPNGIPVIVISGYLDDSEFQDQLEKIRPVATFHKPFLLADLKTSVEKALAN
jgi:CheY-like chemotaxis protein